MFYEKYLVPGNLGFSLVTTGDSSEVLMQLVDEGMLMHEFDDDKLVRERIVPELTAERAAPLHVICTTEFGDVGECFFLAIKRSPTFLSDLVGYILRTPEMEGTKVGVTFYSKSEAIAEAVDMVESSTPGRFLIGGGHA